MYEDSLTSRKPEIANNHYFPFLRYKQNAKKLIGKSVNINGSWKLENLMQNSQKSNHQKGC